VPLVVIVRFRDGKLAHEHIYWDQASVVPVFTCSETVLRNAPNHMADGALGYFAYNFIEIHRTLSVTLAKAAGATDRLWDVEDLVVAWEAGGGRKDNRGRL
jgi:hypothetical protein